MNDSLPTPEATTKEKTTLNPNPKLQWYVPNGAPRARYDFIVEIAEDEHFTKNVRKYSSEEDKTPFSFNSSREANSEEIVNIEVPDPLISQEGQED